MRPKGTAEEMAKANAAIDAANEKEGQRRSVSALIVAMLIFAVAYVFVAANFDRWGTTLGWMPASAIATAFGWIGYRFPWIGDVIAFLIDLLSFFV